MAVVGFVEGEGISGRQENRVVVERKGMLKRGERKTRDPATYGARFRSFRRYGSERGFRAESWSLDGGAVALDAEMAALVRGIEICVMSAGPGDSFNIFTDSQAAMTRLKNDQTGPRQESAARGILLARELVRRGATITIRWVPGHVGVLGNEVVDTWATEAATREDKRSGRYDGTIRQRTRSLAFFKAQIKKRAVTK